MVNREALEQMVGASVRKALAGVRVGQVRIHSAGVRATVRSKNAERGEVVYVVNDGFGDRAHTVRAEQFVAEWVIYRGRTR